MNILTALSTIDPLTVLAIIFLLGLVLAGLLLIWASRRAAAVDRGED